jgi:hypothetical protein
MTTDTLEALKEARAMVVSWAAYADPYFQEKHDLAGDLSRIDAALAPDHIGNSTTMVPTLGVAQIKAILWKHWRNQNGQTLEDRFTSAAEEIATLVEKQS